MCTTDNAGNTCFDPAVNYIDRAVVCKLHVTADSAHNQCSHAVDNDRKADFDHYRRLLAVLPWSLISDCIIVDKSVDLLSAVLSQYKNA
jgi:hypothetical protein